MEKGKTYYVMDGLSKEHFDSELAELIDDMINCYTYDDKQNAKYDDNDKIRTD